MRVAVTEPAHTETIDGEQVEIPESVFAYRFGRIEDFTHPLTGEVTPATEIADALLEQAKKEHPNWDVKLERLELDDTSSENPEEHTSKWVPHEEFNHENRTPGGSSHAKDLAVEQTQEASS